MDPTTGLFVVADGMGGHSAGEAASGILCKEFADISKSKTPFAMASLKASFLSANKKILETANSDPEKSGMGATAVALGIDGATFRIIHVGDSRAYLLREGSFRQLTVDHSVVEEMVQKGVITREEAEEHPENHVITRAIGIGEDVDIDAQEGVVKSGDLFMLCSDGLSGMVRDNQIQEILEEDGSVDTKAKQLVDAANKAGGEDNISVVLVKIVELDESNITRRTTRISKAISDEELESRSGRPKWKTYLFWIALSLLLVVGGVLSILWFVQR